MLMCPAAGFGPASFPLTVVLSAACAMFETRQEPPITLGCPMTAGSSQSPGAPAESDTKMSYPAVPGGCGRDVQAIVVGLVPVTVNSPMSVPSPPYTCTCTSLCAEQPASDEHCRLSL